jgi:DNA-binding transcriptional LysR family regulator
MTAAHGRRQVEPGKAPTRPPLAGIHQLDLNLLTAFEALRLEGSVSAAARRIGITQSGMSRALGRLRDHFRDPLFVRSGTRLALTARGEGIAAPVSRALEILAAGLAAETPFEPASSARTFTVATADYCEAVLLPPLLRRLEREAPRVQINSVPTLPTDATALARGDIDMVIALRVESRADLRTQRLMHETFASLVRVGHPAVERGVLSLAAFAALKHVVVAPHGRPGSPIDTALEERRLQRTTAVRLQSFLAAPALIEGTDLVVTLPRQVAYRLAERYRLQVVPTPIELVGFDLSVSWHERGQADAGHRWLRRLWSEIAEALQDPAG